MPSPVRYRKYMRRQKESSSKEDAMFDDDTTGTGPLPWKDGEGTLEAVKALFRDGELGAFDLVDVGRGWELLSECADFKKA